MSDLKLKKGRELEVLLESELRKLGLTVKKNYKAGKWALDFIAETSNKGTIAIEVKNRRIGIPDVLSIASIANSLDNTVASFSGSIATTIEPPKPVLQTAADNNIAIITIREPHEFGKKAFFISQVVELEIFLRKLIGVKAKERTSFKSIIDIFQEKYANNQTLINDLLVIYELRNKIVHGEEISESLLEETTKKVQSLLDELKKIYTQSG